MSFRNDRILSPSQKTIQDLQESLKTITIEQYTNPASPQSLFRVLCDHKAGFDQARESDFGSLKTFTILKDFFNKCTHPKQFNVVTLLMGEEDINIRLLVSVENMMRFRERSLPKEEPYYSLIADIKTALNKALGTEKAFNSLAEINEALQLYLKSIKKENPNFKLHVLKRFSPITPTTNPGLLYLLLNKPATRSFTLSPISIQSPSSVSDLDSGRAPLTPPSALSSPSTLGQELQDSQNDKESFQQKTLRQMRYS